MKRYLLVLLITATLSQLACTPSSTNAPAPPKTDREKAGLIGAVRTVTIKDSVFSKTEKYDATGNLVEEVTDTIEKRRGWPYTVRYALGADGKRIAETVPTIKDQKEVESTYSKGAYSYYTNGTVAAKVSALNNGSFQDATFYLYDEAGNQAIVFHHSSDHLVTRWEFEYDKYGNIIRESQHSTAFKHLPLAFRWEIQHSYNSDGYRTETRHYGEEHRFEGKSTFIYDRNGNRIEETDYDEKGEILRKEVSTFQHDSAGNWTKKISKTIINPLDGNGKPRWKPESVVERTIVYY